MLVSWNWLQDYVAPGLPREEVERRLAMAGLNHESTKPVDRDWMIDLEITSNRPDCLGHLGVAREIAVLCDQPLKLPRPAPPAKGPPVATLAQVRVDCPDLCRRYSARVLRGVKIASSPAWLVERLRAIGQPSVNNVVDITNYVLMEYGQPLHAFDLARLAQRRVVVRRARPGETFVAINHQKYELDANTCVIADAERAVALGGVMGGADTEVSPSTTELLIESADFDPLTIRNTVRKLALPSPSSYRFERGVDPAGVDAASLRCCELILQVAGGELAEGSLFVGEPPPARAPIVLRLAQIERVLGITIGRQEVERVLFALGAEPARVTAAADAAIAAPADEAGRVVVVPPSWRRDLSREIDLIEEVARVRGYDEIPEDVGVPMAPSHKSDWERVMAQVRHTLAAAGFDEALTESITPPAWCAAFSPWTSAEPLVAGTPMLRGADRARVSLTPSLLEVRRVNEALGNPVIELFETARVYLPRHGALPLEQPTLGLTSGGDFFDLKGAIELLVAALQPGGDAASAARLDTAPTAQPLLHATRSVELRLGGELLGFLGEVSPGGLKQFGLRGRATAAELNLAVLAKFARLTPRYVKPPSQPGVSRDLNFIVAEEVRWADLAAAARQAGGALVETLEFGEVFRNESKDGPGKKRVLLSLTLRRPDRALTSAEADQVCQEIVQACRAKFQAELVA